MEASDEDLDQLTEVMGQTFMRTENGQDIPVGVLAPRVPIWTDRKGRRFIPFLDSSAIDFIVAQIVELIEDKFDCIVMISGARRKGKSTLGMQIARKVSSKFSVDDIAFRLEDFSSILEKNPYADPAKGVLPQAFLDEAGVGLYSKEWMAIWQRNLVKCLEVIGIKRQICYFILPHAKKLTGDIRDEMASLWIDVDTKYKHERGYAELYTGVRDKFKQSIWWKPKFAFKFNSLEGDPFFDAYELKKKAFVDEIAAKKQEAEKEKSVSQIHDLILRKREAGKSVKQIHEETGLARQTIYNHLSQSAAST